MQLLTLAGAAALLATTVYAEKYDYSDTCPSGPENRVRVFNRCPYPVYLWSIINEQGCPESAAYELKPGASPYCEKMREPINEQGVSIKIVKTKQYQSTNALQLEYFLETKKQGYNYNYLDVSYVDCTGGECPTKSEGYYLKSGNDSPSTMANDVNEICPILSCGDASECATMSYINWDDRQTKSCSLDAPLDLYLCGSEAPGDEDYTPAPSSSSEAAEESTPAPSSTVEPSSSEVAYVKAAEITPPPAEETPKLPNIKTEVVYVTEVKYVNAKRHAHVHGGRHQHFHA